MSTIVKNIKKLEYPIPSDTIDICKKLGVERYLPTTIPKDISFELHNTTTEMANALRRCINSELEVLIMDFTPNDCIYDDAFIIVHELRKRINYIPIRQISGMNFKINVHNATDEIIPVYSRSIKEYSHQTSKKKKKDDIEKESREKMFSETFILTYLRPGKRIEINNIHIVSGKSYLNHAAFSFPGKVGYKCLDIPDVEENDGKDVELLSGMIKDPSRYRISIPRQKYVDPVHIVKTALKELNNKLDNIYKIVKESNENFYSSNIDINYLKDRATFKIFNETYTIGNLISKYGLRVDATITNIHCIKIHPSFNYVIVEIHHSNPQKIMLLSIEMIKKELTAIGNAF
jgi:DNA-directed RNA polymerase subunit L